MYNRIVLGFLLAMVASTHGALAKTYSQEKENGSGSIKETLFFTPEERVFLDKKNDKDKSGVIIETSKVSNINILNPLNRLVKKDTIETITPMINKNTYKQ